MSHVMTILERAPWRAHRPPTGGRISQQKVEKRWRVCHVSKKTVILSKKSQKVAFFHFLGLKPLQNAVLKGF
jgi:hypothetical protein